MEGYEDLASFLAEAGPIVGGGAALGAALAYLAGAAFRDLGAPEVNPVRWAERGGHWGAIVGLAALVQKALGVS